MDKVLFAPLPYDAPDDLYFVWRDYTWVPFPRGWLGGTDIVDLQRAGGVIESAAALRLGRETLTRGAGTQPAEIDVMLASADLFTLLGVQPLLGRTFRPGEDGPGRAPLVVLTYGLWNRLGADSSIVGTKVNLDGDPFTVIGVMRRRFDFVQHSSLGAAHGADAYITLDSDLAASDPGSGSYAGLIRARRGAPLSAVREAVGAVGRTVDARDFRRRGLRLYPVPLASDLVAGVRPALATLGAASLFLVLALTVNLGVLLLARAAQREPEIAVARALGANGLALARATLMEGAVLGIFGGAGAALLSVWGTHVFVALSPLDLPRRASIAVDGSLAALTVGTGAVLGLVAALAPALWTARTGLGALLGATSVRGGGGRRRLRRSMVVIQVAFSLVLLSAGGLLARSFQLLLRADPGFDPDGVLTFAMHAASGSYPDAASVNALHARVQDGLAALPGVAAVGGASALPLSADAGQTAVNFPGAPGNTGDEDHDNPLVDVIWTRAGYFETLGMRVLAGRTFSDTPAGAVRDAVIDRVLAQTFFPGTDPVGRFLRVWNDSLLVVGVVRPARLYDVHSDGRGQLYVRDSDFPTRTIRFVLRAGIPWSTLETEVRNVVRRIDPGLAVTAMQPMGTLVTESMRPERLSAMLVGGFAAGALLLSAMGLFGVVSGSVTRRRHELAVRMALGADHRRVVRLVVREGALLIGAGLVVGAPGVVAAGSIVRHMLVGVSPLDPPTLAIVAFGVAIVSIAACLLPARRVVHIDPARALRHD